MDRRSSVIPATSRVTVVLCSRDCRSSWLSEAFTGQGHPNWQGGNVGAYGPGWSRVRRLALERDERTCVVCGTSAEELDRNPDVHHILPVRWFDESDEYTILDAHRLSNVVSLCIGCHRKADAGTISRETLYDAIDVESETVTDEIYNRKFGLNRENRS